MTPDSSLYRVSRTVVLSTLVVASSETHAKMVVRKLPLNAFDALGDQEYELAEITDVAAIPEEWRGCTPWCEPGRENMYDDSTCEDVVRHAAAHDDAVKNWYEEHPE